MIYYGRVTGPGGKLYQCEHNHRTETAAITCANSLATRRMAEMVWQRAADKEARDASLAKQQAEEREASQASQNMNMDQAATEAPQAAARTNTAAAQLKFAAVTGLILGVLAALVAGVLDAIVALVHYHVTVPARCAIAQPDGSVIYTHEPICNSLGTDLVWGTGLVFGIAVLLWILTVIVHALPKAQQVKLEAWASKPREAPAPILRSRYTSMVNAVTPHGTRVRQKCCQRGHTSPDDAARHAAAVKLRIERRGA